MLRRASAVLICVAALPAGLDASHGLTITHRARSLQPGEIVALSIVADTELTGVEVKAFDRIQRAQPERSTGGRNWVALVGIDLDARPGSYEVSVAATGETGATAATYTLEVRPKAFATRELKVDPAFVNPPASEAARIAREAAAVNAALTGDAGPSPARLIFIPPVPHKANSAFGSRSIFNGEPRSAHSGADFLSPSGTPVEAPTHGKVVLADNLYYSGGTVIVDHGMGVVSLFAHLSRILVKPEDHVASGGAVGLVGATGRVTGAHLHWAVRVNGARVDPLSLLAILKR